MLNNLWPVLLQFRHIFIHHTSFLWFCTIVIGLAGGCDDIGGITSIARNLQMTERGYWGILRFFSTHANKLSTIQDVWLSLTMRHFDTVVKIAGRTLVTTDSTKTSKQGRKMPAIIGLKDTSNDCWMRGHQFEQLCLLVQGAKKLFPVPLVATLLTGINDEKSLAERCTEFLLRFPELHGCLLVGDAWYSKSKIIIELARRGSIAMVSRLAHNAVGHEIYIPNPFVPAKKGRKRKYGKKIKLSELFERPMESWTLHDNNGNPMVVQGWCYDLLWKPLKMMVRFVGIEHPDKGRMILISSDVTMKPTDIAQAYVYRFWIEVSFHIAKSLIGSFTYRFWLKSMDRLGSFPEEIRLSELPVNIAQSIVEKIRSIELFVCCACIAQGLLVYLSIHHADMVAAKARFWMRTKRGGIAGERISAAYVKLSLWNLSKTKANSCPLEKFIAERQSWTSLHEDIPENVAC